MASVVIFLTREIFNAYFRCADLKKAEIFLDVKTGGGGGKSDCVSVVGESFLFFGQAFSVCVEERIDVIVFPVTAFPSLLDILGHHNYHPPLVQVTGRKLNSFSVSHETAISHLQLLLFFLFFSFLFISLLYFFIGSGLCFSCCYSLLKNKNSYLKCKLRRSIWFSGLCIYFERAECNTNNQFKWKEYNIQQIAKLWNVKNTWNIPLVLRLINNKWQSFKDDLISGLKGSKKQKNYFDSQTIVLSLVFSKKVKKFIGSSNLICCFSFFISGILQHFLTYDV